MNTLRGKQRRGGGTANRKFSFSNSRNFPSIKMSDVKAILSSFGFSRGRGVMDLLTFWLFCLSCFFCPCSSSCFHKHVNTIFESRFVSWFPDFRIFGFFEFRGRWCTRVERVELRSWRVFSLFEWWWKEWARLEESSSSQHESILTWSNFVRLLFWLKRVWSWKDGKIKKDVGSSE